MRRALVEAVRERGGVIDRSEALTLVPLHVLKDAVTDGALKRIFPQVYALPDAADELDVRRRGALLFRPAGALSHLDALDVWDLPGNLPSRSTGPPAVHVTCSGESAAVSAPGLRLHRRNGFRAEPPAVVVRRGLAVVRLEQAVIESWPLVPELERRAAAIVAVRDRRTTGARLIHVLQRQRRAAGAADMDKLFRLLSLGIHSELEAWGHEHVFNDSRLPPSRAQVPVRLPSGRTIYLDRLYDEELVNVELDGAAYHGLPRQRERDLRRDSALASLGFVTVRFSHPRLHADHEQAVDELLATLAMRRCQLRLRRA